MYFRTSYLSNPACFICALPVDEVEETQERGKLVMQIVVVIGYQSLKEKITSFFAGSTISFSSLQSPAIPAIHPQHLAQCLAYIGAQQISIKLEGP